MTTAADIRTATDTTGFLSDWLHSRWKGTITPYVVCILAQAPYLILYFTQMFKMRPHYQFVPVAILATGLGMYLRWPRNQEFPFRSSWLSDLLFVAGCVFGLATVLFSYPWFSAVSAYCFITSFCARTKDGETGGTMLSAVLPLWVALVLPGNLDFRLITWLQVFSAKAASHVLDLVGYQHHLAGTVLTFPEKSYGVAEACSGIQSFFTLLCLTAVYVVFLHRPWFRSTLLLISSLFWAILMNAIRILLIPIAGISFGMDLSSGFGHAMLGYTVLAVAALLVLSTDQFLTFVFGPVDPTTVDTTNEAVQKVTGIWNRVIAGEKEGGSKARRKLPSRFSRLTLTAGAVFMLALGLTSIPTTARMLSSGYLVQFFQHIQPVAMEKEDLPDTVGSWRLIAESETVKPFQTVMREAASDLGMRSDQWIYKAGQANAYVALDQPFPGWHELTRCYQNQGWNVIPQGRQYKEATDNDGNSWPYIQVELTKPTGQKGFLLFCFFDVNGKPFEAPTDWGTLTSFLVRVQNRLSPEVRSRLFNSESYQVQMFVESARALSDDERGLVRDHYLQLREDIRAAFLARLSGQKESASSPAVSSAE